MFVFFCRADVEEDIDSESSYHLCEEPLRSNGRKEEANRRAKSSSQNRAAKRPDKPLYMPRAARERLSLQNSLKEPLAEQGSSTPASSSSICSKCDSENTKPSSSAGHEHIPTTDSSLNYVTEQPQAVDQSLSSFADLTLEEEEKDKDLLSEVLDRDITDEVKLHIISQESLYSTPYHALCLKYILSPFVLCKYLQLLL